MPCIAQAAGSANTAVSAEPVDRERECSGTVTYSAKNPGKLLPFPLRFSQRMAARQTVLTEAAVDVRIDRDLLPEAEARRPLADWSTTPTSS